MRKGKVVVSLQTTVSPTPSPIEETFHDETQQLLARLRSMPQIREEEDPNGWLWQIIDHLKRSPKQRLARWARFGNGGLRYKNLRRVEHVTFKPARVLRTLTEHGVEFVLVGMGAGYLRGAPYPSYNTDITPRIDPGNLERLEQALGLLGACPLEQDEWGLVEAHTLPGFRRLMTSAGMVNVVDTLPEAGEYEQIMGEADHFDVEEGLFVWVASLEDVIRSKEAASRLPDRPSHCRTMDGLHVLMCKETLMNRTKYAEKWNLST